MTHFLLNNHPSYSTHLKCGQKLYGMTCHVGGVIIGFKQLYLDRFIRVHGNKILEIATI